MSATIANLSAEELFELAKKKQAEEIEQKRKAAKAEIDALRKKRRKLIAEHKKALAQLDAELVELTGKKSAKGARKSSGRASNISNIVLEILAGGGQMSTKDLRAELNHRGIAARNLAQTLAYLKKKGSISSPARSIYQAV